MASGFTQTAMRDEELARALQTEEFSDDDSNITLRQRLAKLKMENLKSSLLLNTNRLPNMTSPRSTEDDSVIIIDDDSDDPIESIVITRPTSACSKRRSNLTRRRTLNMPPALENQNRIVTEEEMIKSDEILARKLQADLDKEFRESQRMLSTQRPTPERRMFSNYTQVTDLQPSNRRNESLEETIRRYAFISSYNQHQDNLRQQSSSPRSDVRSVDIEQEMRNMIPRNISSNELISVERNLRPSDLNRMLNRPSRLNPLDATSLHNDRTMDLTSLLHNSRNTDLFPTHPPRYRHDRNLNIQYSINPYMNGRFQMRHSNLGINNLLEESESDNYEVLLRLDERNIKKGVTKEEIESLSRFSFKTIKDSDSDTTCSICFDDYEPRSILTALVCSHKFHSSCIKKWLNQSRRCPLCQKDAINGT